MAINRAMIVGNLTKDPELAHTASGMAVCTLRVAVNGREKVGGQWRDRADYFDVRVWGNQGDACVQYLSKGKPVAVDGKLRLEEWKKDGQHHSRVLIVADSVQFLPSGDRTGGGSARAETGGDETFAVPAADFTGGSDADFQGSDDDIPF